MGARKRKEKSVAAAGQFAEGAAFASLVSDTIARFGQLAEQAVVYLGRIADAQDDIAATMMKTSRRAKRKR